MVKSKPIKCTHRNCKAYFKSTRALNAHIVETHCENNIFECSICQKQLSTNQALKEHMNIHTGNRPYKCRFPGCSETFRHSSQMSIHNKIHRLSQQLAAQPPDTPSDKVTDNEIPYSQLPDIDFTRVPETSPDSKINFGPVSKS